MQNGQLSIEKEELSPVQQLNEYIMISLRTMEGCDLRQVVQRFGEAQARNLRAKAERYLKEGKMKETKADPELPDTRLVLTREGKLLADGIAADLFF